jgi:diadenylate cyclase
VEYANQKADMELLNTSATSVRLFLRGSRALLKSIRPEQIRVKMDLGKAVEGTNTFPITNDNLSIPPGLSLKEVRPMVVDVNLDTRTQKTLPIQADWVGKLPLDVILVQAQIKPPNVELSGPTTILSGMRTIYTTSIPLNNIKGSGKTDAKIVIPSAFLKLASGFKDTVEVAYEVKKRK